jgi:hypothetical protein
LVTIPNHVGRVLPRTGFKVIEMLCNVGDC